MAVSRGRRPGSAWTTVSETGGRGVCLVNLPAELDRHFVNYPTFSVLGPVWAAGYLREQGIRVRVWEALAESEPGDLEPQGRTASGEAPGAWLLGRMPEPEELAGLLEPGDLLVFCLDMFRHPEENWGRAVERLGQGVRALVPEVLVLAADCYVGGLDYVPVAPERMLGLVAALDGYLVGEPFDGLAALAGGEDPGKVAGLWTRRGPPGEGRRWGLGLQGSWPEFAYDLLDMDRFFRVQEAAVALDLVPDFHGSGRILPVLSSRGCPYRCSFCACRIRRYEAMGSREFSGHLSRWLALGADCLFFLDEVMNLDEERFQGICEILAAAPGLRGWTPVNGLRADRLSEGSIAAFQAARGFGLKVSAESGSLEVLRRMGKGLAPEAVRQVARRAARLGTGLSVHYLVGLPGEGPEAANRTLALAAELWEETRARPLLQPAVPVPGTRLWEDFHRQGSAPSPEEVRRQLMDWFFDGPPWDPGPLERWWLQVARSALEARVAAARDPVLLLEPTFRCNQGCTFCAARPGPEPDPDRGTVRRLLAEARRLGASRLDLSGGEPTLLANLADLVRLARALGYDSVGLVTNGRRLSYEHYARALVSAGVDRFLVSVLSSRPDVHDRLCRVPGAWEQTLLGLEVLGRLGARVALNVTVVPDNARELPDTVRFFVERFSLEAFSLQVALPLGRAESLAFGSLEAVVQVLAEALGAAGSLPAALANVPYCAIEPSGAVVRGNLAHFSQLAARSGRLQPFWKVLQPAMRRGEACSGCPLATACPGYPASLPGVPEAMGRRPAEAWAAMLDSIRGLR